MRSRYVKQTCWAAALSLPFLLAVAPVLAAQTGVAAPPSGDAEVDLNTASPIQSALLFIASVHS